MKSVIDTQVLNMERAAGLLFVLSAFATFPGSLCSGCGAVIEAANRAVTRIGSSSAAPSSSGVVLIAIGFMLLESAFQNTDGFVLANIGATAYFFGGVLLVAAEALMLTLDATR